MKKIICFALFFVCTLTMTAQKVAITKVIFNPVSGPDIVELKNTTSDSLIQDTINVTTWWFCSRISYKALNSGVTVVEGSLNLLPGASVTLSLGTYNLQNTADLGLYTTNSFSSSAAMHDFIQWGGSFPFPMGRENVAAAKGIWTAGNFITAATELFFDGVNTGPGELTTSADFSDAEIINGIHVSESGLAGIGRIPATNILEVNGNASKSSAGDWLANSDARLKKNIAPVDGEMMLRKILLLEGVTYEWNDHQTGNIRPAGIQYGFTAQNIQKVFPELVSKDNLGFLQTSYGTYDAMYVEAIRTLNAKIERLELENQRLVQIANLQKAGLNDLLLRFNQMELTILNMSNLKN